LLAIALLVLMLLVASFVGSGIGFSIFGILTYSEGDTFCAALEAVPEAALHGEGGRFVIFEVAEGDLLAGSVSRRACFDVSFEIFKNRGKVVPFEGLGEVTDVQTHHFG
jgi:hypothetical protein